MKKKLIFLLALFLSAAQFAGAQCLALDAPGEFSLGIGGTEEFAISGPASTLSYEAKKMWGSVNYFDVYQKVNDQWQKIQAIPASSLSTSYKPFSVQLNSSATAIKFNVTGSLVRYFQKVKVTQASYINVSPSNIDFGSLEIGKTTTQTINVTYSSQSGSVSSSNAGIFSVDKTSVGGSCGNTTVQVTFKPTSTGSISATINVGGNNLTVTGSGSLAIPSGLTASNVSYTSANFSWNAVSGASAYLLTNTTNGKTYKVSATSTTISDLVPNNAYTFKVKSLDASDNASAESSPVSINTKTIGVPTNLQASNIGYSSVNLSWNAVSDATGYRLTNLTTGDEYDVQGTSCEATGLGLNTTYSFAVKSLYNTYESAESTPVSATTLNIEADLTACTVLNDASQYQLMDGWSTGTPKEFLLSGPGKKMYFTAVFGAANTGTIYAEEYYADGTYKKLITVNAILWGGGQTNAVCDISPQAVKIKFVATGTLVKSVKDVRVEQAYSFSVSSTTLDFGTVTIGKSATRTLNINYSNAADMSAVFDNEYFSTTTDLPKACAHGSQTITISYEPKVLDTPQASSLVLFNGISHTIVVRGETTPLPAPTNFRVAQASAHSIPLLWDAVEGATAYRLINTTTNDSIDVTETSYTFDDLNAHSDYAFTVSSLYNNEVCGTSSVSTKTYTPLYIGVLGNAAGCISSSVTLVSGDMNIEDNSYKVGSEITLNVNSNNESVEIEITANGETIQLPNSILLKGGDIVSINANYTGVALVIDDKVYSTLTEAVNNASNKDVVLLNDVEENLVIKTSLVLDGGNYSINNLIVNANGSLVLNGDITVASFNIQAQNGASGEFREDGGHLTVLGSVSMDKSLDPSGTVSPKKWYAFSVPFPVSLENGIYRKSGDQIIKMVYGDQYYVQEYDGAKRASTGSGWVMTDVKSTLQPGKFYIFASNGYNDVRFVKTEGSPLVSSQTTLSVSEFASAKIKDTGWNGLANTQLFHVDVNSDVMFAQVYKNGAKEYLTVSLLDESFVVGVPFFIQQGNGMSSVLDLTKRTRNSLRGASENISSIYNLRIATAGGEMSDQLFVSANESASESYVIGKDVEKMGTPTSASTAQLWCVDYDDMNLSVYEAKMKDGAAHLAFRMYAPVAGNYSLYLNTNKIPNDGSTLYLLKDGIAVHDFNNDGEYSFASSKGLISNYELLIKAADDITTVVSENIGNGVFAYIEGDVLYIKNMSEFSSYAVGNSIRTLYSGESDGSVLTLPVIEKGMYWIKVGNQTIKLIKK